MWGFVIDFFRKDWWEMKYFLIRRKFKSEFMIGRFIKVFRKNDFNEDRLIKFE